MIEQSNSFGKPGGGQLKVAQQYSLYEISFSDDSLLTNYSQRIVADTSESQAVKDSSVFVVQRYVLWEQKHFQFAVVDALKRRADANWTEASPDYYSTIEITNLYLNIPFTEQKTLMQESPDCANSNIVTTKIPLVGGSAEGGQNHAPRFGLGTNRQNPPTGVDTCLCEFSFKLYVLIADFRVTQINAGLPNVTIQELR